MSGTAQERRWSYPEAARRIVALDYTAGQAVTAGIAVAAALTAATVLWRTPAVAFTATAMLVATGLVAVHVTVDGDTVDRWVVLRARRLARWGQRRWTRTDVDGWHATRDGTPLPAAPKQRPHPHAAGLAICGWPQNGTVRGVIVDRRARTVTAAAPFHPPSVVLAGRDGRAAAWDGWGETLRWLAHTSAGVVRFSWHLWSVPDDAYLALADVDRDTAAHGRGVEVAEIRDLLAGADRLTASHDTWLAITVDPSAVRRRVADRGRDWTATGADRACQVLTDLAAKIGAAVPGWRTPDGAASEEQMSRLVRLHFDPAARRHLGAVNPGGAWPRHVDCRRPDCYRHDSAWTAVWHVEGLPAVGARGDELALLHRDIAWAHTMTLVAEPVDPRRSARRAERDANVAAEKEASETHGGYRLTARRRRRMEAAQAREEAVVSRGAADWWCSAWLAVTVPPDRDGGPDHLVDATDDVERAAAQYGLVVRRMWGRHADTHAAMIPSGRGVGRIRG